MAVPQKKKTSGFLESSNVANAWWAYLIIFSRASVCFHNSLIYLLRLAGINDIDFTQLINLGEFYNVFS